MPPKRQITEETILDKAIALTRAGGFEKITARGLATELGCSTQPIYRAFANRDALKTAVIRKAIAMMMWHALENRDAALPDDLGAVIAYVQFAAQEKKLFQMIFTAGAGELGQMMSAGRQIRFDTDLLVYANGMIMMTAFQTLHSTPAQQREMLIDAYSAFHGARPRGV